MLHCGFFWCNVEQMLNQFGFPTKDYMGRGDGFKQPKQALLAVIIQRIAGVKKMSHRSEARRKNFNPYYGSF